MKKSPVRVLLVGAAGRMGKTVVDLASEDPEIDIVAQCDLGDPIEPAMKNCDAAIDFSHAGASHPHVLYGAWDQPGSVGPGRGLSCAPPDCAAIEKVVILDLSTFFFISLYMPSISASMSRKPCLRSASSALW